MFRTNYSDDSSSDGSAPSATNTGNTDSSVDSLEQDIPHFKLYSENYNVEESIETVNVNPTKTDGEAIAQLIAIESSEMFEYDLELNSLQRRSEVLEKMMEIERVKRDDGPKLIYLAMSYADRFLAKSEIVSDAEIMLLPTICFSLAKKWFSHTELLEYHDKECEDMEKRVLDVLHWDLMIQTPFSYLIYFCSSLQGFGFELSLAKQRELAGPAVVRFISERTTLRYKPHVVAAVVLFNLLEDQSIAKDEFGEFLRNISEDFLVDLVWEGIE